MSLLYRVTLVCPVWDGKYGLPSRSAAGVGGASDAAHAAKMGIPAVCASGPVVDFQHTLNERVLKCSMAQRAKIHVSTIIQYL